MTQKPKSSPIRSAPPLQDLEKPSEQDLEKARAKRHLPLDMSSDLSSLARPSTTRKKKKKPAPIRRAKPAADLTPAAPVKPVQVTPSAPKPGAFGQALKTLAPTTARVSQGVRSSATAGDEPRRLSKLMTERGLCSRREADELISRGWIKVNGVVVDQLGTKVLPDVEIELHPQAKEDLGNLVTILLNKPVGYVSSQPELGYNPAVILIKAESQFAKPGDPNLKKSHFDGLAPAGRLDIDSQGLLVFTQNGQIAKQLIGDQSDVEKEYLVRVEGQLDERGLKLLNHGLELDGVKLREAKVEWINDDQLRFILKEGRKRQIRRMCELVGLHVVGLKRVRIGNVRLGRLPEGQWRFLESDEVF